MTTKDLIADLEKRVEERKRDLAFYQECGGPLSEAYGSDVKEIIADKQTIIALLRALDKVSEIDGEKWKAIVEKSATNWAGVSSLAATEARNVLATITASYSK